MEAWEVWLTGMCRLNEADEVQRWPSDYISTDIPLIYRLRLTFMEFKTESLDGLGLVNRNMMSISFDNVYPRYAPKAMITGWTT